MSCADATLPYKELVWLLSVLLAKVKCGDPPARLSGSLHACSAASAGHICGVMRASSCWLKACLFVCYACVSCAFCASLAVEPQNLCSSRQACLYRIVGPALLCIESDAVLLSSSIVWTSHDTRCHPCWSHAVQGRGCCTHPAALLCLPSLSDEMVSIMQAKRLLREPYAAWL